MLIRTATPADAQDLAILGERLWRGTYRGLIPETNLELHLAATFGLKQQTAELADPACRMLVIEQAGRLLGYTLLREGGPGLTEAPFRFVKSMEVARFYVDPTLHGRGAAKMLMDAALAYAASKAYDGVWLQVWEQNPRAIRFYEKAGFSDAGGASYRIGHQVDRDRVLVHAVMLHPL